MTARTHVSFLSAANVWPAVERWSNIEDASMKASAASERLDQKGRGLLVAPMMYSFRQEGDQVAVEAWVRCNTLVRLCSLFILPSEMGIESGGFKGVLPRKIAREALNRLLQQFGAPAVQ
jgi:hypothetical protein